MHKFLKISLLVITLSALGACTANLPKDLPQPQKPNTKPANKLPAPSSANKNTPAGIVEVLSATFGHASLTSQKPCDYLLPTTTLPLMTGDNFGWCVRLKTNRKQVKWREEFKSPAPPASWGPKRANQTISADRMTATTENTITLDKNKAIASNWEFLPGDPKGQYLIRLHIEGVAQPLVFKFNTKPLGRIPPKTPKQPMGIIYLSIFDVDNPLASVAQENYHLTFIKDSSIQYAGKTDANGWIYLEAPIGAYKLQFSNLSFANRHQTLIKPDKTVYSKMPKKN